MVAFCGRRFPHGNTEHTEDGGVEGAKTQNARHDFSRSERKDIFVVTVSISYVNVVGQSTTSAPRMPRVLLLKNISLAL